MQQYTNYFFFCSVSGSRNPTEMATATHSRKLIKLGRQYGNFVSSSCRNGSEIYNILYMYFIHILQVHIYYIRPYKLNNRFLVPARALL